MLLLLDQDLHRKVEQVIRSSSVQKSHNKLQAQRFLKYVFELQTNIGGQNVSTIGMIMWKPPNMFPIFVISLMFLRTQLFQVYLNLF